MPARDGPERQVVDRTRDGGTRIHSISAAPRSERPAREVAGSGVTANLVIVRTIDAMHERETAPSTKNAIWTTPEEIAETLAFLASPSAGAVTGARVPLNGRG